MFENLGDKLGRVFKKLRGQGSITETNIQEALRDVRMALLEADANFKVVKEFVARVKEKALGEEVLTSVKPGQQFIKIVHDELIDMMGGSELRDWSLPAEKKPGIVMLLGLQGSGKTTFAGKLAKRFAKNGRKPMLVACDVHRPAAIKQLQVVGATVGVPVFEMGQIDPVKIAQGALAEAKKQDRDTIIFDTAGRLHIDEVRMDELAGLRDYIKPDYSFLVADAMTGQDAVNSAETFNNAIGIDGVCLTKMDGDARGGAALSIKAVTGKPITFIGVGEKPEDLELFRPEGVVSRMLGMGDVVQLVERAQEVFDEKEAQRLHERMRKSSLTLTDFLSQLQRMKKMGSMSKLIGLIPGLSQLKNLNIDDKDFARIEGIILSMTPKERESPQILDGSRRKRVAKGSGATVEEVNGLLKQFEEMKKMMSRMMSMLGPLGALAGGGGMPMPDGDDFDPSQQLPIPSAMTRHAKATLGGRATTSRKDFLKKKSVEKAKKKQQKQARKKK
jgi:signal recognition particle subunit SRP54